MPGVWPGVQMEFITLHSTIAPLGPNAEMRQSHSCSVEKKTKSLCCWQTWDPKRASGDDLWWDSWSPQRNMEESDFTVVILEPSLAHGGYIVYSFKWGPRKSSAFNLFYCPVQGSQSYHLGSFLKIISGRVFRIWRRYPPSCVEYITLCNQIYPAHE